MRTLATIYMSDMRMEWKTYINDEYVSSMIQHERGLMRIKTIDGKNVRINLNYVNYIEYEEVK